MSTEEDPKVSVEDIQMVQDCIEQCLAHYMTRKQVVDFLSQKKNIERPFTEIVWEMLEQQNQEFFKAYYLRLLVKEQIVEFNNLLGRQAALMSQVDPSGVAFRSVSNVSYMPAMHHNASCYASDTGIVPKTENTQHYVPTFHVSGSNNCGPAIHPGMQHTLDGFANTRRIDIPSDMVLAHHSNIGMIQGIPMKSGPGYLGDSRFVYQAGGNVLGAHPTIEHASIPPFRSMDSDSHQLNGKLPDDTSSFEFFRQMSQNTGLPADFTNRSDVLRFSKSAFLLPDREIFLDSNGNRVEHQGPITCQKTV